MTSPAEFDEAITAIVTPRWQKVAMVIIRALGSRNRQAGDSEVEEVASRIDALIEQGKLQCQGNPKPWRRSEVRLPLAQVDRE